MRGSIEHGGNEYTPDPPKTDGVTTAVKCEKCGRDIEPHEWVWRSWERYICTDCDPMEEQDPAQ